MADNEPTMAEVRERLLGIVAPLDTPNMHFLIRERHKSLDGVTVATLLTERGNIYVTVGGKLYEYAKDRGLYVDGADRLRKDLAEMGQVISEEARKITEALEGQALKTQRLMTPLVPKVAITSSFVESNAQVVRDLARNPDVKMNDDWDIINFPNGLLHVPTMELYEHSPEILSSIQLPFEYDPAAGCPEWQAYLEAVVPDADERSLLQELIGHFFESSTRFEVVVFLVGQGGTGKGTLVHVVTELVGAENVSGVALDKLGDRFQTAQMEGKLLNVCAEGAPRKPIDEAQFKALVSGDRMTAEQKHKDPYPFKPTARIIIPTNGLPKIADPTNALFDRLLIFEFNQKFKRQVSTDDAGDDNPDADPELFSKLKAELSGIFNWAMEGLGRLRERGRFAPPASVVQRAKDFRHAQNPVWLFLEEYEDKGAGKQVSTDVLHRAYEAWRTHNRKKPMSKIAFARAVSEMKYPGISKNASHKDRGFLGIGPGDAAEFVQFGGAKRRMLAKAASSVFDEREDED